MKGSRSNSLCSSSSAARTLRLLAVLERQVLMYLTEFQSVHDGQHLPDHPAHIEVFVFLKLCEEVDQFADEPERARHEFLRLANAFGRVGEEAPQQTRDSLDTFLARLSRPAFEIVGKGDDFAPVDLAVLDSDELQIVRQKNVVRKRLVALDLIRLENL